MDGEMSSLDESVIGGCHPWMEMTDDGHGQSICLGHPQISLSH